MKNMMTKSTIREIKGSFSRWLAILGIVMLGVGFFCGLKVCKDAFALTGDTYLDAHNFYDYRLVSTLGLDKESVKKIGQLSGVKEAQGSISTDVLYTDGNLEDGAKVAKLHTISNKINTLSLVKGRMPKKSNECVVDALHFTDDIIGKTITLTRENEKDTLDMFSHRKYVVTGMADSPEYLNFERGFSSLGDGKISAFIYITPEGWDADYYTEIYVDLEKEAPIFTPEYKAIAGEMEKPLEKILEECGDARYDDIIGEANEEIKKAESKLADAKHDLQEGQRKLEEKEKEIADAQKKIEKNENKLNKSEIELKNGRAEYEKGLADYETQRQYVESLPPEYQATAMAQLEMAKAQLEETRITIEKGEQELAKGRQEIEKAKKKIADGKIKIAEAKIELQDGQRKVAEGEEELDDAKDKVYEIEHPTTYVLGRNTNIGYSCFENDSSIVDGIAKVFPIFFFLVAALVVMTTMTRMVDEQRTQIGVLKALGYSKGTILNKYVAYSGSATLIGGTIGFISGSYIFPWVIWYAYQMMYDFSDIIFVIDWKLGIISILTALVCAVGSTLFSCFREMTEVPSQLIRPKTPAMGKRIFLERIGFIWNRLSFLRKVSLRNIFRYKKRFFMMIVGVCGCTALLVAAFGINDSVRNVVSDQYDKIYHVDYSVTFSKDIDQGEKDEFLEENEKVISKCLFLNTQSVDIRTKEKTKSLNMIVADKNAPIDGFIDLFNDDGPIEYPKAGQCVINSQIAKILKLKVGDTINLYDQDLRQMKVKISALCQNYVYNYVYINKATYEKQWGNMETNTAFVIGNRGDDGILEDPSGDGARLMKSDNVAAVSVTQDFRDRIDNMMKSLNYIIMLVVFCAGALAFIVLYNLTNINITERIREIATIKVLGFYPRETSAYVFRENIILTAIAALVGLPVGKLFHKFIIDQIQIDMMSFNENIAIFSYVIAVVLTFVMAAVVNFVMRFRLEKVSMTESLKSIE